MLDLEKMKAAAMAATPGPWIAERDPSHFDSLSTITAGKMMDRWPHKELIVQIGGAANCKSQEATTKYIATANPSAVLELIERLEKAEHEEITKLRETIKAQAAVIENLREAVRKAAYMVRENTLTPGGNPWALQEIEAMAHKTYSTQILDEVRRAERERVAQFVDDNCTYGDTHILVKAIRAME